MSPHLAGATDSSLSLIYNEGYFVINSDLSESLIEVGSGHVVLECANWFDNNGSNIFSHISSLLNNLSNFIKASIFLSSIFMFKLSHGVSHLRERSSWPVKSWNTLEVYSCITARESAHGVSMISMVKAKDAKV